MSTKTPIIEKKRGDTISMAFYFGDGSAAGYALSDSETMQLKPVDLTGITARLQLRDKKEALYLDADLSNYLSIPVPASGYVYLTIPANISRDFPVTHLYGDIEVTYPDGTVESTSDFVISVLKDQTRTA